VNRTPRQMRGYSLSPASPAAWQQFLRDPELPRTPSRRSLQNSPSSAPFLKDGTHQHNNPVLSYGHDSAIETTGCSITGGVFYNPATLQYPEEYKGDYFFADFCSGWI
jgi:hypothetical protein